jgi:hypothetical protein
MKVCDPLREIFNAEYICYPGRTVAIGKVTKLIESGTIDETTNGMANLNVNA